MTDVATLDAATTAEQLAAENYISGYGDPVTVAQELYNGGFAYSQDPRSITGYGGPAGQVSGPFGHINDIAGAAEYLNSISPSGSGPTNLEEYNAAAAPLQIEINEYGPGGQRVDDSLLNIDKAELAGLATQYGIDTTTSPGHPNYISNAYAAPATQEQANYNTFLNDYNTQAYDAATTLGGNNPLWSQILSDVAMAVLAAGTAGTALEAMGPEVVSGVAAGALGGAAGGGTAPSIAGGALTGGIASGVGSSAGDALGSQTAGQALTKAGQGALTSAIAGQNPLIGASEGAVTGGLDGTFGTGNSGTNVANSGGSSSASGALASPTSGGDLTSLESSPQYTPIPSDSTGQQSFAPGSDASTVANFLNPTSSVQPDSSGATAESSGSSSSAGGSGQANSSVAPLGTIPPTGVGSSTSGGSGQPNSSIGAIASALPAAATASLPSILAALGVGGASSGSATSAVVGGSGVQSATGVQNATGTPAATDPAVTANLTTPSITLTPDEMGMALTPDMLYNANEFGYSGNLSSGGQLGYGSGSFGRRDRADSGLPSGYSVAQTASDFGV